MTALTNAFGMAGALHAPTTLLITDADSPGGAGLFAVPGPWGVYFAANLGGSANITEALVDGELVPIVFNADPATNLGGKQVYADESETGTDGLLIADWADDFDRYIKLDSGRCLKIKNVGSPSGAGVAINVKYDEAAGARLRATTVGNANVSAKTSSVFALVKALA